MLEILIDRKKRDEHVLAVPGVAHPAHTSYNRRQPIFNAINAIFSAISGNLPNKAMTCTK